MKQTFIIGIICLSLRVTAQIIPNYKVPVPATVSLSHTCTENNVKQYLQGSGTSDPFTFNYTQIESDKQGDLYFLGYIEYMSDEITFGNNSQVPITKTKGNDDYRYFLAKFKPDGRPVWVNLLTLEPKKMIVDDEEQLVYLAFSVTSNGIVINDIHYPLDSANQGNELAIFSFNKSDGSFKNLYKNRYTVDFIKAGNKKILVYSRAYTSTYFDIRYGFFEQNKVKSWPYSYLGYPVEYKLRYNPYQNTFWSSDGTKYTRLIITSGGDSIYPESVSRNIYHEFIQPFNILSPAEHLYFLPDGGYIGIYLGKYSLGERRHLVRCDSLGNPLWRIISDNPNLSEKNVVLDNNGDIWINFDYFPYYQKIEFESNNSTYFISEFGNVGVGYPNCLWKIDGKNGTFMQAAYNGYATVAFENKNVIYRTPDNHLITTPGIGSIAYFPDASGNYKPYFSSCSNRNVPSQALWNSYNLNNLQFMGLAKKTDLPNFIDINIYPNPTAGQINLVAPHPVLVQVYNGMGQKLQTIQLQGGSQTLYLNLPDGVYSLYCNELRWYNKLIIKNN